MLRLSGLKVEITKDQKAEIKREIIKKLKISPGELLDYKIFKRSVDARKGERVFFVYTVDIKVSNERKVLKNKNTKASLTPNLEYTYIKTGHEVLQNRPIIVGAGPAGLFCGLILAEMGYQPRILERGRDVDTRTKDVEEFWQTGKLKEESNVQFGEGGAGTFSDGKLTTLIKNPRCRKILTELVKHGAPAEILYVHKPHVGTDVLKKVVKNIRKRIIDLGGEVRFNCKVTEIIRDDKQIKGVIINNGERIKGNIVVLAVGHSARDTFGMLVEKGVKLCPKAFAIGVRIEHPQDLIDSQQYGVYAGNENLGAADYKLVYHASTGRGVYSFCMCPGGLVVAAASEKGGVVTNGMSYFARNETNANSALLVGVEPNDFPDSHPLAGVEYQRIWERLAFEMGGKNYYAPAQLVGDFLADRPSTQLGAVRPSYKPGIKLGEIKNCLPLFVTETLQEGLIYFDTKIKGFAHSDALLTGVETRSSSPVRIIRDSDLESINTKGFYPCGEGAGYAGGIVSAAVDGIMVAEAIGKKYKPF